ncbi:MAG: RagB/SusD family nutrient uptake outer membrane protein [Bacteroidales bacterium]|nr:RagB/SusD family nutrient uptake outer membrane protein [Bacteroidales bacterium]
MKTQIFYKIHIAVSAICLVFILGGCEDLINLEPRGQMTIEKAMSTLDGVEGAILGVYDRGRFVHGSDDYSMFKLCHSDLIKIGSNLTDQAPFNQFARLSGFDPTNTAVRDIWNGYYTGLARANKILDAVDALEINENDPSEVSRKNKVKGEALYFRAYFHKSLVERWENIVLSDHVFDDPNDRGTLAASEDVYALIVSDLNAAIPLLPDATPGNVGVVSKAVAMHLLSLVYMTLENFTDAAELAVAVINNPAYSLAPVDDIFGCDDQTSSEIIFSWQFYYGDNGNPQRCSVQLTPLYDRVDGVVRTFDQGGRPWARLHPSDYYWTLFEDNPDDLRLEAWHKRYWFYNDEPNLPAGVSIGDTVTPENVAGTSGFEIEDLIVPTVNKYWEDSTFTRAIGDAEGFRNIILWRVSEAYLTAAEAYLRAGQAGTGQQYLDAVRARANVPSIPLTLENLIDEHARELGLEGHRYAFLKRLGILRERVINYTTDWPAEVYRDYHVRWPIPQGFVDVAKVAQNEGYEAEASGE